MHLIFKTNILLIFLMNFNLLIKVYFYYQDMWFRFSLKQILNHFIHLEFGFKEF